MSRRTLPRWLLTLAALLPASRALASDAILVVTSDASVANYRIVQEAFVGAVGRPVKVVDLEADPVDSSSLEAILKATKPPLVYCIGSRAYLTVHDVAPDHPIVLSSALNWQRLPAGKGTRVVASELSASAQLTLFRYFFPGVTKVGVLFSKAYNKEWHAAAVEAGKAAGIEVRGIALSSPGDVSSRLDELLPTVDALWIIPDPIVLSDEETVTELFERCRGKKKPTFTYSEAFVDAGAVLVVSPDLSTLGRQAAALAKDLLGSDPPRAVNPLDPAGSSVTLNMKAVDALGLQLNQDALSSVNRIVE